MAKESRTPFSIVELSAPRLPIEKYPKLFAATIVITWSIWLIYYVFEVSLVYSITSDAIELDWRLWTAIVAEFFLALQEIILAASLLFGLSSSARKASKPSCKLIGTRAPSVDVFITCCGEAIDIIIDTVNAVAFQEYPSEYLRIFVLDDGHDNKLRQRVEDLAQSLTGKGRAQVKYLSRSIKKGQKSFFKAGNLNYGIRETERIGCSEYFAGVDCDMIPESDWLSKGIAPLILSDKIGMTVGPQNYYNVPPGDPLGQQAYFSMLNIQEVLNDFSGASMCRGTGYIARRKAVEDIGGWPSTECGEDYMCSALLSNSGWQIAYIKHSIQYGLCPESIHALLKQRMRWTNSGIEVHKHFGFHLRNSSMTSEMSLPQKVVNLLEVLRDYAPITNILALLVLPLGIHSRGLREIASPQHANSRQRSLQVLHYLLLASYVSNKICTAALYHEVGLSHVWNYQSNEVWAAPYMAYRCFISFLPASINMPSFAVSGAEPASERSLHSRAPFIVRLLNLKTLLWIAYALYASLSLIALNYDAETGETGSKTAWLFPGPILKVFSSLMKVAVPIRYMMFPPTMPPRDSMLFVDEQGQRRVREVCKQGGERRTEWQLWAFMTGLELAYLGFALR